MLRFVMSLYQKEKIKTVLNIPSIHQKSKIFYQKPKKTFIWTESKKKKKLQSPFS